MPARERKQRPYADPITPKYQERERLLILRFLASLTLDAMFAIKGIREFAGDDLLQEQYQKQLRYHKARIDTYRLAAVRACGKQRHLLEMTEELFREICESWQLPCST